MRDGSRVSDRVQLGSGSAPARLRGEHLGGDAASDVVPSQIEGVGLPIHMLTIVALGVDLFNNQGLDAVAETAARLNRWEFMVIAAPLAVEGGTGSPVNVLAIF